MKSARDRYMTDPAFSQLVRMMESFLHKHEFTPSEMREAAVLASIKYHETHTEPHLMFCNPELEESLKKAGIL